MRTEIRIGGFGGQGVILAGIILGKAASLFDEKEAVQTQSYGPEARGGAGKGGRHHRSDSGCTWDLSDGHC